MTWNRDRQIHVKNFIFPVASYQQLACQHWDDAGRSGTLRPTLKQEYEVDVEEDEVEETNKTEDTEKVSTVFLLLKSIISSILRTISPLSYHVVSE